ncbi:MAG: PDZ domain-containing protein, partial [Eubacteriales bacterium]|nr:PDZ domain-containing protein [Eubacteriales bacterium]
GGALINMDGELIGINVAKLSDTSVEGIGYSIPIYKVNKVITDLSNAKTKVEVADEDQGRLGIYMNTVSQQNADALGIPAGVIIRGFSDEAQDGYTEEDIQESPAKDAGLMKNDIITKFDNQSVSSAEDLAALVKYYEKGTTVDVTVQRLENGAYTEKVIPVTLGEKKQSDVNAESKQQKPDKKAPAANSPKDESNTQNESEAENGNTEESESDNGKSSDEEIYDMFKQFLDQYK